MMESLSNSTADLGEPGELFADLNQPNKPDMEAFISATRLNLATLRVIDRIVAECARAVARRHMEIVQWSMAEVSGAVRTMAPLEPQPDTDVQRAELLKRAYERGVSSTRELSELIRHSNDEALRLLNARVDALSISSNSIHVSSLQE